MADLNIVALVGRLTRDAELKYSNSGVAITKLSLAINSRTKKDDTWQDEAHFFDAVLLGRRGEAIAQYLVKGKQIAVQGELRQDRWEQGRTRAGPDPGATAQRAGARRIEVPPAGMCRWPMISTTTFRFDQSGGLTHVR
jgi:primosomal replication protein N